MLHLSMRYFIFSEHGLIRFNGFLLSEHELNELNESFFSEVDDSLGLDQSCFIRNKGYILSEDFIKTGFSSISLQTITHHLHKGLFIFVRFDRFVVVIFVVVLSIVGA